ncbi:MAG: LPS O-antigen length regulator, partial [Gammaproteobacteria bacterium]|nr:LPS O-antigen length regulator [Gammaproteobacteria bacterium]
MNQPPQNPYPYPPPYPVQMEDEISLIDLWRVLTKRKTSILLITLLTTLGAIIYALTAPAIYRAEVLMVSAQSEKGGGGMAALASQFGGLAGMAGISLGGAGGGTETALAVLQSRSFAQQYIQERNLKPLLFPEQWDQEKG